MKRTKAEINHPLKIKIANLERKEYYIERELAKEEGNMTAFRSKYRKQIENDSLKRHCLGCGKEFTAFRSDMFFCTSNCRTIAMRKNSEQSC